MDPVTFVIADDQMLLFGVFACLVVMLLAAILVSLWGK